MPAGRPDLQEVHDAISLVFNWCTGNTEDDAQFRTTLLSRRALIEEVFAQQTGQVLVPRVPLEHEVPFP